MRIRNVDNPVVCGGSLAADTYRKRLAAVAGQELEVDTEYMFKHMFNTVCGLGVTENVVAEVIDDIRPAYFALKEL
jgi:hypothetical protein